MLGAVLIGGIDHQNSTRHLADDFDTGLAGIRGGVQLSLYRVRLGACFVSPSHAVERFHVRRTRDPSAEQLIIQCPEPETCRSKISRSATSATPEGSPPLRRANETLREAVSRACETRHRSTRTCYRRPTIGRNAPPSRRQLYRRERPKPTVPCDPGLKVGVPKSGRRAHRGPVNHGNHSSGPNPPRAHLPHRGRAKGTGGQ